MAGAGGEVAFEFATLHNTHANPERCGLIVYQGVGNSVVVRGKTVVRPDPNGAVVGVSEAGGWAVRCGVPGKALLTSRDVNRSGVRHVFTRLRSNPIPPPPRMIA